MDFIEIDLADVSRLLGIHSTLNLVVFCFECDCVCML